MQALQVSGQAAEFRDPLPAKGPANGEVDTAEHPFMKLLARLRNAMKQGEEPAQGDLEEGARLHPGNNLKVPSQTQPPAMKGIGLGRPDTAALRGPGLEGTADLATEIGSSKVLDEVGKKTAPGQRVSSLANQKSKAQSSLPDSKAALKAGDSKASDLDPTAQAGKGSEQTTGGTLAQTVQRNPRPLAGEDDSKQAPSIVRNSDSSVEPLAKRRTVDSKGKLEGATVAASGNLNGAMNLAGLTRNQNSAGSREKSESGNLVEEAGNSGRKPSRYSVVDMRLKASAQRTSAEGSAEGKQEGKTNNAITTDQNRSGIAGTDAAGRQIGSDQPASGFSEAAKGLGSEGSDKAPTSFAENLAARLKDGGAMDIVRSAQIILKDGDAGLIRLRLEPESLGGVKIELKMADKQISARIIVESDLAGEAFRSSLDSLRDAFASSGFETTSIEVEVRDGRAGTGDAGRGDPQDKGDEESRRLYAARKIEELGDAVPSADVAYGRYGVIDLVV
jgi:flagellar hook-length control protein FliK